MQIVVLLQQGITNKEIGLALGLSQHTVRDNISPMLARFHVKNRAALLAVVSAEISSRHSSSRPTENALSPQASARASTNATDRRAGSERRSSARPTGLPLAQDE